MEHDVLHLDGAKLLDGVGDPSQKRWDIVPARSDRVRLGEVPDSPRLHVRVGWLALPRFHSHDPFVLYAPVPDLGLVKYGCLSSLSYRPAQPVEDSTISSDTCP